jgi:hypothetical protein
MTQQIIPGLSQTHWIYALILRPMGKATLRHTIGVYSIFTFIARGVHRGRRRYVGAGIVQHTEYNHLIQWWPETPMASARNT